MSQPEETDESDSDVSSNFSLDEVPAGSQENISESADHPGHFGMDDPSRPMDWMQSGVVYYDFLSEAPPEPVTGKPELPPPITLPIQKSPEKVPDIIDVCETESKETVVAKKKFVTTSSKDVVCKNPPRKKKFELSSELEALKMIVCLKCGRMFDSVNEKLQHRASCSVTIVPDAEIAEPKNSGRKWKVLKDQSIMEVLVKPELVEDVEINYCDDASSSKSGEGGQFVLMDKKLASISKPTISESTNKLAKSKLPSGRRPSKATLSDFKAAFGEPVEPQGESDVKKSTDYVVWSRKKVYLNHKCHLCPMAFTTPYKLKRHLSSHRYDGYKQYRCQYCNVGFLRKDNMAKHVKSIHESKGEVDEKLINQAGLMSCALCNTTFRSKHRMTFHMKHYHPNEVTLL